MVYLVMVDMSFILMTLFGCGKIQVPDLLQGISGGTSTVIYHVLTLEKSDKKFSFAFCLVITMVIRNKLL